MTLLEASDIAPGLLVAPGVEIPDNAEIDPYVTIYGGVVLGADVLPLIAFQTAIHREVTTSGVRVYSLCGSCGARLEASATLCEDCAQRRSRLS